MSQAKKDRDLPSVLELATLAASLGGTESADKQADKALRIWFASKFLLERMEAKIRECPEEDRALLQRALDGYTYSDVAFDEVFNWKKQHEIVSYEEAKEITGIRSDETFQKYLAKVLRGEPTPAELKIERRMRADSQAVHVPTPAELKRDGISRSVLKHMITKKRRDNSKRGRKNRTGKTAKSSQGQQPMKGGNPIK